MRTQPIRERAIGQPWLEHYPTEGGPPEQTPVGPFPFTIGRNETADFQIESGRVSREHAVILKEDGRYRIEDLGSTNGTFVNGRAVGKATLDDGDIILIADIELSFFSGQCDLARNTATQVMESPAARGDEQEAPVDVVREVRRLHEMLAHRCITNRFQPIAGLDDGHLLGYEALADGDGLSDRQEETERLLLAVECRLTGRMRHLRRMVIAEEASALAGEASIFLGLDSSEIGTERLPDALARLQEVLSERHRLVVEVPDSAFSDTPYFREFRNRLKELGIGLAHDGFSAGEAQVTQQKEIHSDFLKLAGPLVRNIHTDGQRQERFQSVVQAAREMGCKTIATGVEREEEAATCRQLGCDYAQGSFFGPAQPIDALCNLEHE